MKMQDLRAALKAQAIVCTTEYALRDHVSFKLPCTAALAIFPQSAEALTKSVSLCREMGVPTVLLGRGSNLFFARARYDGAVILTDGCATMERDGDCLVATCGVSLLALCLRAAHSRKGESARAVESAQKRQGADRFD